MKKNGNVTKDLNKGITGIQYNSLNLPSYISYSSDSQGRPTQVDAYQDSQHYTITYYQ